VLIEFGDQNTHFVVIISQLKNLVIKTQLFGDQNTFSPQEMWHLIFSTNVNNCFFFVFIFLRLKELIKSEMVRMLSK